MKEIASALSEFKVHGGRMNEQQMKIVERNVEHSEKAGLFVQ